MFHKGRKKKLILHIGMTRTGTSSIQGELIKNKDKLYRHGVKYFFGEDIDKDLFEALFFKDPYNIQSLRLEYGSDEAIDIGLRHIKKKFIEFLLFKNKPISIVSAEGLSFCSSDEVGMLKDFLLKYYALEDIYVIYYAREPISHMKSMIAWNVKQGYQTIDEAIYTQKGGHYFQFIESYSQHFKNIIVRPYYNYGQGNQSIVDDFLLHCGIKINIACENQRKNEALGKYATIIFSELLKKYPRWIEERKNMDRGMKNGVYTAEFFRIFSNVEDVKFDVCMNFNQQQKDNLNDIIARINQNLDEHEQFGNIDTYEDNVSQPKTLDDIPRSYFIDLINSYNKYIEKK